MTLSPKHRAELYQWIEGQSLEDHLDILGYRLTGAGNQRRASCVACGKGPRDKQFSVELSKGWTCWTTGAKGWILELYQHHGWDGEEAAARAAGWAPQDGGYSPDHAALKREREEHAKERQRLRRLSEDVNEKSTQFDFAEAIGELTKASDKAELRRWAANRRWRADIVHHAADVPGWLHIGCRTHANYHAQHLIDRGVFGDAQWFFLRYATFQGAEGTPVSASRRGMQAKGRYLSGALVGNICGNNNSFGDIRLVFAAIDRGERVYIVEGGPDWLALSAYLRLFELPGAVVGACDMHSLIPIARAIKRHLVDRRKGAQITIIADRGKGEEASKAAADILYRHAEVRLGVPFKGDTSDVMTEKGPDGVTVMLASIPIYCTGPVPVAIQRPKLKLGLRGAFDARGVHAFAVQPGIGKSTMAVEVALDFAAANRFVGNHALPTNKVADEIYKRYKAHKSGVKIIRIESRNDKNCEFLKEVTEHARTVPGGGSKFCGKCPNRDRCLQNGYMEQWQKKPYTASGAIKVCTLEQLHGAHMWDPMGGRTSMPNKDNADFLILDESPLSTRISSTSADREQIKRMFELGELQASAEVQAALTEALTPKDGPINGKRQPSSWGSARLCEICPLGSVKAGSNFVPGEATAHAYDAAGHLDEAPQWTFRDEMIEACSQGWTGCTIDNTGTLSIDMHRSAPEADTVILLDATASEEIVKSLYPRCVWHDAREVMPPTARVVQATYIRCRTDDRAGWENVHEENWESTRDKQSELAVERAQCIRALFDGAKSVQVTHQKCIEDEWFQELQGAKIYHKSADAVGSNAYEDHDVMIADEFHLPAASIAAQAESLVKFLLVEGEAAHRIATEQMLGAATVQLFGRTRPYSETPCTLVHLGRRAVKGMEPDVTLNVDLVRGLTLGKWTGGGLVAALRTLSAQGAVIPFVSDCDDVQRWHAKELRNTQVYIGVKCNSYPCHVKTLTRDAISFQIRASVIASKIDGVRTTKIQTSRKKPISIIHSVGLSKANLIEALAGVCSSFQWGGRRVLMPDTVNPMNAIDEAARQIASSGVVSWASLGRELHPDKSPGAARGAIQRVVKSAGMVPAEWIESFTAWEQGWPDEVAPPAPQTVEEMRDAIAVVMQSTPLAPPPPSWATRPAPVVEYFGPPEDVDTGLGWGPGAMLGDSPPRDVDK